MVNSLIVTHVGLIFISTAWAVGLPVPGHVLIAVGKLFGLTLTPSFHLKLGQDLKFLIGLNHMFHTVMEETLILFKLT